MGTQPVRYQRSVVSTPRPELQIPSTLRSSASQIDQALQPPPESELGLGRPAKAAYGNSERSWLSEGKRGTPRPPTSTVVGATGMARPRAAAEGSDVQGPGIASEGWRFRGRSHPSRQVRSQAREMAQQRERTTRMRPATTLRGPLRWQTHTPWARADMQPASVCHATGRDGDDRRRYPSSPSTMRAATRLLRAPATRHSTATQRARR